MYLTEAEVILRLSTNIFHYVVNYLSIQYTMLKSRVCDEQNYRDVELGTELGECLKATIFQSMVASIKIPAFKTQAVNSSMKD